MDQSPMKYLVSLRMMIIFLFAILAYPSAFSVNQPTEPTCADFLTDGRFHWAPWPNLERQPPPVFSSQLAPLLAPRLERLPEGMEPATFHFFNGVFRLLRDLERVHQLMMALQADVISLSNADLREAPRALEVLLRQYERHVGLEVQVVDDVLDDSRLAQLLLAGKTFVDRAGPLIRLELAPGMQAAQGRWRHLSISHRLQVHLVIRDMILRPEYYGSPSQPLAFYRRLGERVWLAQLDWSQTGLENPPGSLELFKQLFDSAENNASSPGFFDEYKAYWARIPLK